MSIKNKETQAIINKMLDGDCTDYEISRFVINNYFIKGYMLSDFEDDLILTYNLTETAAENLIDKAKEVLAKINRGKEISLRCKKCNTAFKIIIIESDVEDPLGYCLACPACGESGIFNIGELK